MHLSLGIFTCPLHPGRGEASLSPHTKSLDPVEVSQDSCEHDELEHTNIDAIVSPAHRQQNTKKY
jgi:hypothetical protein